MNITAELLQLPLEQTYHGEPFPFALRCVGGSTAVDAARWATEQAEILLSAASLHGAVFLRGLPLETAEDLDVFVASFSLPNFPYSESLSIS